MRGFRPQFRTRRFWVVQGLVLLIAVVHDAIEAGGYLPKLGLLYFLPITLFLLPVVYAGLVFGLAGAVATATWVTLLNIPNWVFWHQGMERAGSMLQFGVLSGVSILVGWRVDRERSARRAAEAASLDLQASQARYRHLFESSPVLIFFLDADGMVLEANAPASRLLGREGPPRGARLAELIGAENAARLLGGSHADSDMEPISVTTRDGAVAYYKPILRRISGTPGRAALQLVLRDVTEERTQRAGLKAYAASVIRTQEEERQRIARELHDETVQAMTMLCRQLDGVETQAGLLPPEAARELGTAKATAGTVVKGLRDFAVSLRPPLLDDLGLVASVRKALSDMGDRSGIEVVLKVDGDPRRLSPDAEIGLYRIAQEALANVERHSGAREARVVIAFEDTGLVLEVVDDGHGFSAPVDPTRLASAGHLGLVGMVERAELLGGTLTVESGPAGGTRVAVRVPVTPR